MDPVLSFHKLQFVCFRCTRFSKPKDAGSFFIQDDLEEQVPHYRQNSCPKWRSPAFMQLSDPNDITAITTSSFKKLNVPTIATLIDIWTCDNSLSFYFDTITTTLTANSTDVSATITAQMNSSVLNLATHAKSLFLLCNEDNSEFMTPSLLLPFNQDNSAIMTATHANCLLLFNSLTAMVMVVHKRRIPRPVHWGNVSLFKTNELEKPPSNTLLPHPNWPLGLYQYISCPFSAEWSALSLHLC